MFNIEFYETGDGFSDVRNFLDSLRAKADSVKDARIQFGQAARHIQLLQDNGTNLPIEIAKNIEDEIWELRPGNNRIFFFFYCSGTYVLLHHYRNYRKKSQKTPRREILRAKEEMEDYILRKGKTQ